MKILQRLALAALLGAVATPASHAFDAAALPQTASGHAYAEVRRAVRKADALTIELRFVTDEAGYSGEAIYADLDEASLGAIHVEAGGRRYDLARDAAGKPRAPTALELTFNYDPSKNPRVGSWKGVFSAPPGDVVDATLFLPNVAVIGPFAISDH
ncbi:hypothetical protein [Acuticoccus mangrovi]|uniref:Uncharacterized protein n=1 Tax=Acuticoccus mangrovi TaxID=2796142 RepID=A0A934MMK0_9HYPH|nr:hypothetical protein [Acuticoccus mangrovi]MBJ3777329.1 hypothetical protein [Acuticoccus mangrovi]